MKKGQVSHKNTPYTFKGLCWLLLGLYMNDDLFSQETITLGSKHPANRSLTFDWILSIFMNAQFRRRLQKHFLFFYNFLFLRIFYRICLFSFLERVNAKICHDIWFRISSFFLNKIWFGPELLTFEVLS